MSDEHNGVAGGKPLADATTTQLSVHKVAPGISVAPEVTNEKDLQGAIVDIDEPRSPSSASTTGKDDSPKNAASDSKEEPKPGIGNFVRILKYANRLELFMMLAGSVAAAGAGVAMPLMNVVFGHLTGNFTAYFIPGSTTTQAEFEDSVNQNALYLVYLFIGKFVLDYVSIFCFRMTGIRISAAVRLHYLQSIFRLPVSAIDKLPPGSATEALTTAANTIQMGISDKVALFVQAIALIIGSYVVAFKSSWQLTLASSSCMLFIVSFYSVTVPFWIKSEKAINDCNEKASGIAGEVFKSIRTVKSLCAENAVTKKYYKWIDRSHETSIKSAPLHAFHFAPAWFAIYANMALTFWFGVHLYAEGHLGGVGDVVVVLFSVLLVVTSIGELVVPLQNVAKAAAASAPLFKIIDAHQRPLGGLAAPEVDPSSDITFKGVHFAYPSRPSTAILKGLDLHIPASKITALVGSSGCGKSTIVGLVERWYQLSDVNEKIEIPSEDPKRKESATTQKDGEKKSKKWKWGKSKDKSMDEEKSGKATGILAEKELDEPILQNSGKILVGGHDLESLDLKWWRSQIGFVQQEPFLFNETILENVAKGLIGTQWEDVSEDEKRRLVADACKEAFADEFIRKLPDGYDTKVGESGIKLSGGQRQRLAIARSIVKRPSILILDEATSAIDVRSERIVQAALDRVSKSRTTITIAHRLSTIMKADNIVVLQAGVSVEMGTHQQLLENPDGVYTSLVQAQSLELGDQTEEDATFDDIENMDDVDALERLKSHASSKGGNTAMDESGMMVKYGFFRSVGLFLWEQRSQYIGYFFVILSAALAGGVYAVQSFLFSQLITVFEHFGSQLVSEGNFWALMFFILSICAGLFYAVLGVSSSYVSAHVSTTYRKEYFQSILGKPVSFYDMDGNSSGTLTARLSNDPKQLMEILGINLAMPLVSIFNIMGCTIVAFVFGWKLALVTFFAALPLILGAAFLRFRAEVEFESYNAKVFSESSKFAAECIGAFRTVSALTMENSITSRYNELLQEHVTKAFKKARLAVLIFAFADSIEMLCMALAFWYGGQLLGRREYNVTQFFVIYIAVVQGGQGAGMFLAFGPNIALATAAANRILNFRGTAETAATGAEPDDFVNLLAKGPRYDEDDEDSESSSDKKTLDSTQALTAAFDKVRFVYPTRPAPVFKSLSMLIKHGEYVAFVGPSGCGKTSIISMLERFYPISDGHLRIGVPAASTNPSSPADTDIADIPLGIYRGAIALVSQEPTLFSGTVRENLVLGLPDPANTPQSALEHACRAAELHDFIASLPQGYDTSLAAGSHPELSGGQKQRLCIARALLRRPRMLLLDEATSSLDSHSERLVQSAIEKLARRGDMTIVAVAHRLATIQGADTIYVMGEGGRVLESGKHDDLIRKRGVYYGMCRAQALDR